MTKYVPRHGRKSFNHDKSWRFNGLRGRYLLAKGFIYVLLGLSYIIPVARTPGTEASLAYLVEIGISVGVMGWLWIIVGIAVIVGSFRSPPGEDGWAFQLLAGTASFWAIIYMMSWILGDSTRGWVSGAIFAGMAFASYTVAGMVSVKQLQASAASQAQRRVDP